MGDINSLLTAVNDLLLGASGQPWIYAAVVIACIIDGFFPPFPSETIVVGLASLSAAQGVPGWLPLLLAAAVGAFLGDNVAYATGRGMGPKRFRWMRRPRMQRTLARVGRELDQRGLSVILTARFIPVGRVAVSLSAGAAGFPRKRFAAITALSSLLWAGYTVGIGALAGAWIKDNALLGAAVATVVAIVVGLGLERLARVVLTSGQAAEAPVLQRAEALR
ncbi:DedA family protein [Arthrobacter livingstonensis]|nr:DedA family protein [Arthrobacter livingstonensis]